MNTLSYPKEHTDNKTDDHEEVSPYPHAAHIADGGEFLDDGIRMHDQPLGKLNTDVEDETLGSL